MTELEKAEQVLSDEQEALDVSEERRDALKIQIDQSERKRDAISARIGGLPENEIKEARRLDQERHDQELNIEKLRPKLKDAEAAVAERTASRDAATKECERAQRDDLDAQIEAKEAEIARVVREVEARVQGLLLDYQQVVMTRLDLTKQEPRARFRVAAGQAGDGGNRHRMWDAIATVCDDMDAIGREAYHQRWLDELRRSRGQPTAREAEDARVQQMVTDLGEAERAAERRRRHAGEMPPLPPPPPPARTEASWADKSRRED